MNRDQAREANRARFLAGAELLALFDDGMPCRAETRGHTITYAENAQGETVGKRDAGPWADVRMNGVWR